MEFNLNLLKTLWSNQLEKEYDSINWAYKLNLHRPQIKIVDVISYYGQWDPLLREIKISFLLIQNYPWPIVLEIFKHEIAHQIITDSNSSELGHGPLFKSICRQLGVDDRFQKAQAEIILTAINFTSIKDDPMDAETNESQKLLQRIEKLLSLAQSNNQYEALSAMEKVNELYEKYNLDRIQSKTKGNLYQRLIIDLKSSKVKTHYSIICSILKKHYFVETIYSDLYNPKTNTVTKTIELFGLHENLIVAEYVFHFLCRVVDELWTSHAHSKNLSSRFKRSFQLGVLHGFYEKLNLSQDLRKKSYTRDNLEKSLQLLESDSELHDFINSRYPRLSKRSRTSGRVFGGAFSDGVENGKSIIINKGIGKDDRRSLHLLK